MKNLTYTLIGSRFRQHNGKRSRFYRQRRVQSLYRTDTTGDLKEKQRKPVIGFHADIPFDKRHGMRFEATYNKNKIDIYNKEGKKLNGIISKTATVYSDYSYTQSVSESTRFRSSISRGYSTSKRNVLREKGATATPIPPQNELLTLQVDGEIRQDLDEG